jgi:hypothetical protein
MAQSKGKYWLANNPSAEINNDEAAELDALLPAIPQAAEADVVVTQSANPVTGNDAVTIADGAAPSNDEIYELAIDTSVKLNALLAKLRLAKIIS